MLVGMWLIIFAGVVLALVLLYWVVRIAVIDGVKVALQQQADDADRDPGERLRPSDLIGLGPDKPRRRSSASWPRNS